MPSLFKPLIIRYVDPEGRRVPKETAGAKAVKQRSKQWYGRYSVAGRRRIVPLKTRDKQAAQVKLADIFRKAVRRHDGLDPFAEHRKQPLTVHLDDFERGLTAKGRTAKYGSITRKRVESAFEGCKFVYLSDVSASALVDWLAGEREADRMGIQTSNYYLRDCKAFFRWLVKDARTDVNPLAHLAPMNAKVESGLERRPLSADEFARLVEAARKGPTIRNLSGADRAMMYTVAAYTGLRVAELASLEPEAFELDGEQPSVTVDAAYSKRRRRDVQPLRLDVARAISKWLADKPAGELLWPGGERKGGWRNHAAKLVKADLKAARDAWIKEAGRDEEERRRRDADTEFLAYEDAEGRVADFHSLRHRYITELAAAGVNPKVVQTLARHSSITLSLDRYTHVALFDQSAALDALPALPAKAAPESLRATGTDGNAPTGQKMVAPLVAPSRGILRHSAALNCTNTTDHGAKGKAVVNNGICSDLHQAASGSIREAPPGFEPGMADLQSTALPLG